MPKLGYDRYAILKNENGSIDSMPFIRIPMNPSDKYEDWNVGFSRMDKLAEKYYDNAIYDFLILYANPEYVNEFDIPDNTLIRIPFPLANAKADYEAALKAFKKQ